MSDLNIEFFVPFIEELYHVQPFPWQMRLAKQVVGGAWPKVIALPTASGKTSVIDIAVFALACQANWSVNQRTAPRRIFYVVDRRVIVDEAFLKAQHLAKQLAQAKHGVLRQVADQLRQLAHNENPLGCYQLRGGIYRDDNWARTPIQPTVIASTVDQIGSRLLFRGYGLRSGSMRPIHAGLVAYDSLIILDEAHCAIPFGETVTSIERYRQWADQPINSPFAYVTMTATPPPGTEANLIVQASVEDRAHPVLGQRLSAVKPTDLIIANRAKDTQALPELANELVQQAKSLVQTGELKAIGIIVNRVATAKMVYSQLSNLPDADTVLLIGRMRSLDRDHTMNEWLQRLNANTSGQRKLERPVYVVATQCLEVGANLDFDGLVSECASLDALRQRFGRLNRMGRDIRSRGIIVIRTDQIKPKHDDPIYGSALPNTWAWLVQHAHDVEMTQRKHNSKIDMGVAGLDLLMKEAQKEDATSLDSLRAPSPDAPVILPAYIDCWAQTAPEPQPSPDEALFLHGVEHSVPDVQVIWRTDLNADDPDIDKWTEVVSLCPPTSGETMLVPMNIFRKWLMGYQPVIDELADVSGTQADSAEDDEKKNPQATQKRSVLLWNGPENSELITSPADLYPGDTVVIPVTLGGWDLFGYIPDAEKGVDLGEQAHRAGRLLPILRLHPALMRYWPDCPARQHLSTLAQAGIPEDLKDLKQSLNELAKSVTDTPWLANVARELSTDKHLKVSIHPYGGLVLQGLRRLPNAEFSFTDEDDTSSATVPVTLKSHCSGVSAYAATFAQGCDLPQTVIDDLTLAGQLHDLGKADPRFQVWLHGGNHWKAAVSELLAKSETLPQSTAEMHRTRVKSGYPKGARHELLSVRLIESAPALLKNAHDPDLVLHLIECHHGYCRPFAPVINDPFPIDVSVNYDGVQAQASSFTGLERLDSGVAERFWRLTRRYGWWGLAYLESLFRLADHCESRAEQDRKGMPA
jgi:CRISPR-associated endonuclease/helicase Cas3